MSGKPTGHGPTSRGRIWKKGRQGRAPVPVSSESECGCGKRSYRSKGDAQRAARMAVDREHEPLHAYHCPEGLGSWHIGHPTQPKRRAT